MPKILKQTSIYKSKLFNIFETKIQFGDRTFRYEVISGTGSGAVMIIPIIDKSIIFIKEYAAAVDDYMITLPKGKIDEKETMYQAAGRELQEEIGYKSDNIKYIIVGLLVSVIIFYFKDLSLALGQTNRIPLILSVWAPVIALTLFTLIGVIQINEK